MKKYVVRVIEHNNVFEVKASCDNTSFKDMKEVYNNTKDSVKSGVVTLISICNDVESVVYSKTIENKEKIDEVLDSLIDNLNWLIMYIENAKEYMSAIDMSRDVQLKKIELYSDYLGYEDSKENIFNELQEILSLRRKIKYSNLLVETISKQINLNKIIDILVKSREITKEKPSVNVLPESVKVLEKQKIKDIFELDGINKIKTLKKNNDKIIVLNNSITPIKKVDTSSAIKSMNREKDESIKNDDENIAKEKQESKNDNEIPVIEKVLYKGSSYKKIKGDKIALKKSIINNFEGITDKLKSQYNYIAEIQGNVYGYMYKKEYEGMALVELHKNFTNETIIKKNKEFSEIKVVDGKLYCLEKGVC